MIPTRFELVTPRLGIWCSIRLSYGTLHNSLSFRNIYNKDSSFMVVRYYICAIQIGFKEGSPSTKMVIRVKLCVLSVIKALVPEYRIVSPLYRVRPFHAHHEIQLYHSDHLWLSYQRPRDLQFCAILLHTGSKLQQR